MRGRKLTINFYKAIKENKIILIGLYVFLGILLVFWGGPALCVFISSFQKSELWSLC